jgi:hypothetical protein
MIHLARVPVPLSTALTGLPDKTPLLARLCRLDFKLTQQCLLRGSQVSSIVLLLYL